MGSRCSVWGAVSISLAILGLPGMASGQASSQPASRPAAQAQARQVDTAYPGLACGALTYATLADLPAGTLLESGTVRLTEADLSSEMAKAPAEVRDQLAKNSFFFLEQVAAQKVILDLARREAGEATADGASQPERELMRAHFEKLTQGVKVTDAEVKDFYENNKDLCGGAPLNQMKDQIEQYVLQQKEKAVTDEYVRTLGQRVPIRVSADWTAKHAVLARDNPVDKARFSGKPSMVDFGASGCRPCDMMAPILKTLEKKYEGKANIVFVHVREQQVLGARYGVEAIPTQVFFDKGGREVYRHTGFYPQAEIENHLAKMGVK
jgi:thiol-disulfide isomerase/thioredoxin